MITILVAMSENGVIGNKGKLPWHIPEDLKLFKKRTLGHLVIMGRKTYESLPKKPLPGRLNVVVSRETAYVGTVWANSVRNAIEIGPLLTCRDIDDEAFVIGGAEIYKQALPFADRILVSKIPGEYEGDIFFPSLEGWTGEMVEEHKTFSVWEYRT